MEKSFMDEADRLLVHGWLAKGVTGRPRAWRVPLRRLVAPRPAQETRWQPQPAGVSPS